MDYGAPVGQRIVRKDSPLAAFAGLRLGEAAGLQVGDVDYLRRMLLVRRQVQRAPGGAVEVRDTKYGRERSVDLPDEMLELLEPVRRGAPAGR